jgi:hypothetical protein
VKFDIFHQFWDEFNQGERWNLVFLSSCNPALFSCK